jgi:hypothetical protein
MSPDGTQFAICPAVGAHILDSNLQLLKSIDVLHVYCVRFLVHSAHLVLGTSEGDILLYDLGEDKISAETTEGERHGSGIAALYESHCGRFLCSGSYDTKVWLRLFERKTLLNTLLYVCSITFPILCSILCSQLPCNCLRRSVVGLCPT